MTRLLVTGGTGLLGGAVVEGARGRGWDVTASCRRVPGRSPADGVAWAALDLAEPGAAGALVERVRPDAVIHTAAMTSPAEAEADPARAFRVNAAAAGEMAAACARAEARIIHLTTDLVFDGQSGPYGEEDVPTAASAYGRSKAASEAAVAAAHADHVVVRTSLLLGRSARGDRGVDEAMERTLRAGGRARLFVDELRTPLAADDLAAVLLALCGHAYRGLLHVAGPAAVSRYDLGVRIARARGLDLSLLEAVRMADVPGLVPPRAPAPVLRTDRLRALLPALPRPRALDAVLARR
ncbi:MAG: sugar nucleotide-binding protein [Deltaproteobacteria bacterium]|nr:sugar nucleotide-binding protein [Deltaproteobacteria bacterium]